MCIAPQRPLYSSQNTLQTLSCYLINYIPLFIEGGKRWCGCAEPQLCNIIQRPLDNDPGTLVHPYAKKKNLIHLKLYAKLA